MAQVRLFWVRLIGTLITLVSRAYLLVPPKTPVLSGFEPAATGSNRELVCDAYQPGVGAVSYKWFKYSVNKNGVEDWESRGSIGTSQKYIMKPVTETRVFRQGGQSELVTGKYKCRASNSAGSRDSEWGDLYVYKPCSPNRYNIVAPFQFAIGNTFALKCYIPSPSGNTVYWTKRSDTLSVAVDYVAVHVLKVSKRRCSMDPVDDGCGIDRDKEAFFKHQITNARTSDSGYWTCRDIGLPCKSNPVKIIIQVQPRSTTITGFPSGAVLVGTQQNLKCVASPAADTYDWYKDNNKLSTSLTYDFQVKKGSAGVYKCVATNTAGSATSSLKKLTVYYKADSVVVSSGKTSLHVGEKDTFTCRATGGNPSPTLKIYLKRQDSTPVEVTQGQARVMAKEDNQAEYYCVATVPGYIALTMRSSLKTYSVTYPNTKLFFTNNPTAAVLVGHVKSFRCETDESNPISSLKWSWYIGSSWRDITTGISSSERNGAYGGKIRISEVSITATKAMNGAKIRCKAVYDLTGHKNTLDADTIMSVHWKAAELTMVHMPNTPVTAGGSASIMCETDSSNTQSQETISWYRNSQQITSGVTTNTRRASDGGTIYISQLKFTTRKEDNQAKYECKINDQTNMKKEVTITVYYPANVSLTTNPQAVKEGDHLTLTCKASGGNPTTYKYSWYYKGKKIQNEKSDTCTFTAVKYTQTGPYRCRVVNYSPGGVVDVPISINILYKAKWNPDLQKVPTVVYKPLESVTFFLHVIANPPPTNVSWFDQHNQSVTHQGFNAAKVNSTTYTLSKKAVSLADDGSYSVNVTNEVGISVFSFKLLRAIGPPHTPCCLRMVNVTAISVTLAFKSNFSGRSPQTFTVEYRGQAGLWSVAAKGVPDPGFSESIVQRITGLRSNASYEFRVKAINKDGSSGHSKILQVKTTASPVTRLTYVKRHGTTLTARWVPIHYSFTSLQIKYCRKDMPDICRHVSVDGTVSEINFEIKGSAMVKSVLVLYLEVFDGPDLVFRSPPFPERQGSDTNIWVIVGVAVTVTLVILVVVVVVVILYKRRKACFLGSKEGRSVHEHNNSAGNQQGGKTIYVNVNPSFEEVVPEAGPVQPEINEDDNTNIQSLSIKEFKKWLLSHDVTNATYKTLVKHGLHRPKFFIMLDRHTLERVRLSPIAQEILVHKLLDSLQPSRPIPSVPDPRAAETDEYDAYAEPYDTVDALQVHVNTEPADIFTQPTYFDPRCNGD